MLGLRFEACNCNCTTLKPSLLTWIRCVGMMKLLWHGINSLAANHHALRPQKRSFTRFLSRTNQSFPIRVDSVSSEESGLSLSLQPRKATLG